MLRNIIAERVSEVSNDNFINEPLWKYSKVNSIILGMRLSPEIERPQMWYLGQHYGDRLFHRYDGPAIYDGNEIYYYQHARAHRADGPAMLLYTMEMNGEFLLQQEEWYLNGRLHRTVGPASIKYSLVMRDQVVQKWYHNGVPHRNMEEGPAYIMYKTRADENGIIGWLKYYVNGAFIRDQELRELPKNNLLAPTWPIDPLYPPFGSAFTDRMSWQ